MSDWKSCGKSPTGSDYTMHKLEEQDATHRIKLDGNAWLLARERGAIVDFAVFEFHHGNADDENYNMLLHGSGVGEGLRECRHIYWGDNGDGYTFSLDFRVVESALKALRQWFD